MPEYQLHHGDCLDVMRQMPADSIDAIVTDPPYALTADKANWRQKSGDDWNKREDLAAPLSHARKKRGGFMGKEWDAALPDIGVWLECLRVLKPGGYMLAFGGTRTYHRLTCSIEDAGFEIRDSILTNTYEDMPMFLSWQHGQGFPKGRGCLKPAWEPIVLARKPGKKVLPLGIAECKVATDEDLNGGAYAKSGTRRDDGWGMQRAGAGEYAQPAGRWPPNLLLVHSPLCSAESCDESCVVRTLGEQSGERNGNGPRTFVRQPDKQRNSYGEFHGGDTVGVNYGDTGTAARFFPQFKYCSKASRRDRNEGCEGMEAKRGGGMCGTHDGSLLTGSGNPRNPFAANSHPCVKPTPLLEWLVRLACPEGGTVLDPFCGSGSTGKACMRAGRRFIGIEMDEQWLPVARARIEHERAKTPLIAEAG